MKADILLVAMSVSVLSVPIKPTVVLFSRHSCFFRHKTKTGSNCCAGMTLHLQCTVRKLTLINTVFWEFFDCVMVLGCQVTICSNISPVIWLAELSLHRLDP